MKRAIMVVGLIVTLVANTGCLHRNRACNACNGAVGCRPCPVGWQRGGTDYGAHLSHSAHRQTGETGMGGPATAQVAYPYYTVRGPRDFLLNNPPTIGR